MARIQTENREYIPKSIKAQILKNCNGVCSHCGTPLTLGENFTLEHVIPLSKGGANSPENLVALCETCNKEKSNDVIEPITYYTYLTTDKKKQLQKLFDEYCENTDWVEWNNLFKTDKFDIVTYFPVVKPNRSIQKAPITFHVEKVDTQWAFDFLSNHKSQLCEADQSMMYRTVNELTHPYYKITAGSETVMLISAYIVKMGKSHKTAINTITLDMYVKPNLKTTSQTVPALCNCIEKLLFGKIRETICRDDDIIPMAYIVRSIRSDFITNELLRYFQAYNPNFVYTPHFGDPYDKTQPCVMCAYGQLVIGSPSAMQNAMKKHDCNSRAEYMEKVAKHPKTMQKSFEKRLKQAKSERKRKK